jgi:protein-disulfide isomerase
VYASDRPAGFIRVARGSSDKATSLNIYGIMRESEKVVKQIAAVSVLSAIAAASILLAPHPGRAQAPREETEAIVKDYLAKHPDEVGEIAKGYLIRHPEAIVEILAEWIKHRKTANASAGASSATNVKTDVDRSAAVKSNAALLFSSPHQVTLGNPAGDVTVVEFFDYNCGYCKRALPDMLSLIKDDAKLKIVLKEFPILGPGSGEAARVAVAVRMQDPDGQKYLAFHQQLLGSPGPASKDKALAVAKEQGLDMKRLEEDMASEEVLMTIDESVKLARAVGINGTPGYVIGNNVVLGAVGAAALKAQIDSVRTQSAN